MGSKRLIVKHILPIILKDRGKNQCYVEPFVGGGNSIGKVQGRRVGGDSHSLLIKALKLIRDNPQSIPDLITEADYATLKSCDDETALKGFVGFAMSFGGKFFGGYARDVAGTKGCVKNMETMSRRAKNSAKKQSLELSGVDLVCSSYAELAIPENSIIYCDPPYRKTTRYKNTSGFNHDEFYEWCLAKSLEGHTIFVSEYSMPDSFECVWSKHMNNTLGNNVSSKKGTEKLFRVNLAY